MKTSVKFTTGIGMMTVFVSTMDDVIYANFRKNIILPFQMVTIKGSHGELAANDFSSVAQGTGAFIKEMKPHALAPTNAKELILKDADYSTPMDHYFGYLGRHKASLDAGSTVKDLEAEMREKEMQIIQELYYD